MFEDPSLQLARRRAGRQAELEQPRGQVAVGAERFDLAAGGVEREHQRADELLAQRVRGHQAPQLVDRLARPAELDQRACAGFLGLAAQVLEPPHLGPRELGVGEVAERWPAPERERAVEQLQRGGGGERGRPAQALLEALRVDLLGRDREPVAGAVANQQRGWRAAIAAGLEERAQVGHPHGQRASGHLARHVPHAASSSASAETVRPGASNRRARMTRSFAPGGDGLGDGPATSIVPSTRNSMRRTLRQPEEAVNAP